MAATRKLLFRAVVRQSIKHSSLKGPRRVNGDGDPSETEEDDLS